MDIINEISGATTTDYAAGLNRLALLYQHMNRYEEVLPVYQLALEIFEEVPGGKSSASAKCLGNLGFLYIEMGRHQGVLPYLQQDLAIGKANAGKIIASYARRAIGVSKVARDITERKQAEHSLRESEEKSCQIAETMNEDFDMTDPARSQMIYISPACEKIWGRTCLSLYTLPHTWLEAVQPENRERVTRGPRPAGQR